MSELIRAIRTIAGTQQADALHLTDAEVLSVDLDTRTASVRLVHGHTDATITARLMASVSDGCLMIPVVGTTVVVAYSDYVEPYIALHGDVDTIVWLGGEYDGVPIVKHPTNVNKGLLKRLNLLEDALKTHLNLYNAHVHPTPAGLSSAPSTLDTTVIVNTSQPDIEHPNITH